MIRARQINVAAIPIPAFTPVGNTEISLGLEDGLESTALLPDRVACNVVEAVVVATAVVEAVNVLLVAVDVLKVVCTTCEVILK
jgi:hypothetical protein